MPCLTSCHCHSFYCCYQLFSPVVTALLYAEISPLCCVTNVWLLPSSSWTSFCCSAFGFLLCELWLFCVVEHLYSSSYISSAGKQHWQVPSFWQVWCLSVLRETAMATLIWWHIPTWRMKLWSKMTCQRGTSHDASTRVGAFTGQAVALSTRRTNLAWPVTAQKGRSLWGSTDNVANGKSQNCGGWKGPLDVCTFSILQISPI